jgi:hypothetical protein
MMQGELVTALTGDDTVSALIGTRAYLAAVPDTAAKPYIVMTVTGGGELETQQGAAGLGVALVELAAVAETYLDAHTLHTAARAALRAGEYADVSSVEPLDAPRDAPNIDNSAAIFAVNQLWSVAYKTA